MPVSDSVLIDPQSIKKLLYIIWKRCFCLLQNIVYTDVKIEEPYYIGSVELIDRVIRQILIPALHAASRWLQ